MCIEESKHTKISQSKLDDRTDLGRADDGEEQMGKRHAHSRLAQFFSDAQIISFDITMKRNRKPREMKKTSTLICGNDKWSHGREMEREHESLKRMMQ